MYPPHADFRLSFVFGICRLLCAFFRSWIGLSAQASWQAWLMSRSSNLVERVERAAWLLHATGPSVMPDAPGPCAASPLLCWFHLICHEKHLDGLYGMELHAHRHPAWTPMLAPAFVCVSQLRCMCSICLPCCPFSSMDLVTHDWISQRDARFRVV